MKLLAIDTSTEQASIALLHNNDIKQQIHSSQRQHAQFLLPMIDALLSEFGLSLHQLDGIVFGQGPGSFTGIRIACSVAKGLAYAHDLPLLPASTLTTIAEEALERYSASSVLALIDARMNQVYWQFYSEQSHSDEHVNFAQEISIPIKTPIVIAGVGFESYLEDLPPAIIKGANYVLYPTAAGMLRLAKKNKLSPVSADEALPVYIRNQVT